MTDVTTRVERFEFLDSSQGLGFSKLKLTVDNFDLAFLDHPAWIKGNLVRFFWGYPGKIQGPRYAVVDTMHGFQKLEISCIAQAALTNEARCREWKNTTRAQIVYQLVKENAFPGVSKVDLEQGLDLARSLDAAGAVAGAGTSFGAAAGSAPAFSGVRNEKPRDFTQSRQTDWQFVLRLAEQIGFEVYVEDDSLHFHAKELSGRPIRRYEWFNGAGDMLEFDIDEWRAADQARVVEVSGRDPIERANMTSTGSNATTSRDVLGDQGTAAQKTAAKPQAVTTVSAGAGGGLISGKKIVPLPSPDPTAIANMADSQFRRLEQSEVEATAIVIGDPILRAARLVELAGVSQTLSGNYYLKEVTHEIDKGGYRCHMKLMRNAVTALPTSSPPNLDDAKAKENSQGALSSDRSQKLVKDPSAAGSLRQVPS